MEESADAKIIYVSFFIIYTPSLFLFLMDRIYMILICFRYDVMWPVFYFQICLGNVFTHNTHAQELKSSNKDDDTGKRWPAGNRISEYFFSYNNENNHKKGKDRQKNAKPGCKGHRGFGKN